MLDFDLTEEQRLLEQSVREWGAREVLPKIHDLDREHRFDRGIFPQMADLGLLGASVPAEYGGGGAGSRSPAGNNEKTHYITKHLCGMISVHPALHSPSLLTCGTRSPAPHDILPQALR